MKKILVIFYTYYYYFYRLVEAFKYKFGYPRSFILPKYFYTCNTIYQAEQKFIFSDLWIFAGITLEFHDRKRSWVRKKIAGKEILITSENGRFFALENVCPHKNIKFVDADFGDKPLTCRYHAWSFEYDGSLKRIPFEDRSYKFNKNQKSEACLTSYQISVIGIFIFIKINNNDLKIEDQFDDEILNTLLQCSSNLLSKFGKFEEIRDFNWKLNFENLRDALHPSVLHHKTLANKIDFSAQYEDSPPLYKNLRCLNIPEASSFSMDGSSKNGKTGHLDKLIKPSFNEGYYNWLLYPNFHMASPDGGRTYSIEVHYPLSANQTKIFHYVLISLPFTDDALIDEIVEHRLRGLRPVLEEDYEACEQIQEALAFTQREQNIGCYEYYNVNIADLYRRIIGK